MDDKEFFENVHKTKKKKLKLWFIFANIGAFLILLFVIFESYIAFSGFNAIKNGKEPSNCIEIVIEEKLNYTTTTYNFGLYKVIKVDDSKKYTTKLLPFFLD